MESSHPPLLLASESRYKQKLFHRLGLPFHSQAPSLNEDRLPEEAPLAMAIRLAGNKALAIRPDHPDAFIVAADQVISLESRIFHKPGTRESAIAQLLALQGQTHTLITAVALSLPSGPLLEAQVIFEMEMRPLSPSEIAAYIDQDTPFDCAGSYKIEAAGIRLFRNTRGPDPSAIEGLPLTRVWALLEEGGYFL